MRLLLDTHALLWTLGDSPRLSKRARDAIADPANENIVSAASVFEIATKHRLGKLPEADILMPDIEAALLPFDIAFLGISARHVTYAGNLPIAHGDPFDRLLIAQAEIERMPLVSNEKLFDGFGVTRLW